MRIAIIGGGAAGFFSAICAAENYSDAQVIIFEKSNKLLAKVKISGGGRCNVTNATQSIKTLSGSYPRGGKKLKNLFTEFGTRETVNWFESRGVKIYAQDDKRMFPVSNKSDSIVNCLQAEAEKKGITIAMRTAVTALKPIKDGFDLELNNGEISSRIFHKVIVASGGSPKRTGLTWLEKMGHKISEPVPSLFTFNIPKDPLTEMPGVAVENAMVSIEGSKLKSSGPVLITHWGLSGPAVLKLSAFGARFLSDVKYDFKIHVNWAGEQNANAVAENLVAISADHPKKQIQNIKPFDLPERLWVFLLEKADIHPEKIWGELSKKLRNKLIDLLTNDIYSVKGKTTFKEEFVTCGGVSLESVNMKTMESKVVSGLYFAGEVLDIDGVTGGFNFQSAWTTGFFAGKLK